VIDSLDNSGTVAVQRCIYYAQCGKGCGFHQSEAVDRNTAADQGTRKGPLYSVLTLVLLQTLAGQHPLDTPRSIGHSTFTWEAVGRMSENVELTERRARQHRDGQTQQGSVFCGSTSHVQFGCSDCSLDA
jgi:hypothetical protein